MSTEYIESDPPIYRSYYPNDGEPARRASSGSSSTSAGSGRSPTSTATSTTCSRALDERPAGPWTHLEREPPDPGARLGLLPQQGRLRGRQDHQRPRRAAVRRSGPARRVGQARARRDRARPASRSTSSSRSRARTSWSTWRCRRATSSSCARMTADAAALRALHDARARQAGQDALLPRPAAAPAPLRGRVRRGARDPRPGDARLHAAVVSRTSSR